MSILGVVIVSHLPLIISTVGCGREQEVQATLTPTELPRDRWRSGTQRRFIITAPHWIMYAFGAAQTRLRG